MNESAPNHPTDHHPEGQGHYDFDPADFADFDDFAGQEPGEGITHFDAQMASHYINPEETAIAREAEGLPPVDPQEHEAWLQNLTPAERQVLQEDREIYSRNKNQLAQIHEKLTREVPELYQAHLPADLEQKLGGKRYAIGFNQTFASNVGEATERLNANGGIDITGYHVASRFLMFDDSMATNLGTESDSDIAKAIDAGYYGDPDNGRFVAAFPEDVPTEVNSGRLATDVSVDPDSILPGDAFTKTPDDGIVRVAYSTKYIAGFIDNQGEFWVNDGFAVDDTPQFRPHNPDFVA